MDLGSWSIYCKKKFSFGIHILVSTLAHGQLSFDLNGGDITAPLKHQGKIEQQYNPGNIDISHGKLGFFESVLTDMQVRFCLKMVLKF